MVLGRNCHWLNPSALMKYTVPPQLLTRLHLSLSKTGPNLRGFVVQKQASNWKERERERGNPSQSKIYKISSFAIQDSQDTPGRKSIGKDTHGRQPFWRVHFRRYSIIYRVTYRLPPLLDMSLCVFLFLYWWCCDSKVTVHCVSNRVDQGARAKIKKEQKKSPTRSSFLAAPLHPSWVFAYLGLFLLWPRISPFFFCLILSRTSCHSYPFCFNLKRFFHPLHWSHSVLPHPCLQSTKYSCHILVTFDCMM